MDHSPNEMDIITVQNVDSDPMKVVYDGKDWGDINPGQIRRFPRFLAEHVVKHLIDQILNRLEKPTSNLVMRKQWADQIVIDQEQSFQPRALTEQEKLEKELQTLNKQSDLDAVLNRHKARAAEEANPAPTPVPTLGAVEQSAVPTVEVATAPMPVVEPTPAPVIEPVVETPPTPPLSVVESQPVVVETPGVSLSEAQVSELPSSPQETVEPGSPTRESLYAWARDNMHMDINEPKTKAALDATPVPQLIEDLQFDPAA